MQFHKAILPTVIVGASIALSSLPSRAAVITYTDRNSFLAALSSSSTDNYNDLATGYVSSPLNRSIPGYDYNAVGLILLSSDYGSKILWNGVNGDFLGVNGDILTLNITAGSPTAVGGYFFNFDSSNPINDVVTVTAYPGAIAQSTVTNSATNFGVLLVGATVTEGIFNVPGVGNTLFNAIIRHETPTVVSFVTIFVVADDVRVAVGEIEVVWRFIRIPLP
jgi:hypothetical protein